MSPDSAPRILLIGRPNVGKSTLFNRLLGKRQALEHRVSGTTRDWVDGSFQWNGQTFTIIDTAGFTAQTGGDALQQQAIENLWTRQLKPEDLAVLVCDGQSGLVDTDKELAERLRKRGNRTAVVVNKIDHVADSELVLSEFYGLGISDVFAVSSLHGLGIGDLGDWLDKAGGGRKVSVEEEKDSTIKLVIAGAPNVGKSTYINALAGEARVLVSAIPGTTRDVVAVPFTHADRTFQLLDTAGTKRTRKLRDPLLYYGHKRLMVAFDRADTILLMLDAARGVGQLERRLADEAIHRNRPLILVVNKWDTIKNVDEAAYRKHLRARVKFLARIPVFFISAQFKKNIHMPIEEAIRLHARMHKRIREQELISCLKAFDEKRRGDRDVRIKFCTQVSSRPLHFVIFVRSTKRISPLFTQALRNHLCAQFDLEGTNFKLTIKKEKIGV